MSSTIAFRNTSNTCLRILPLTNNLNNNFDDLTCNTKCSLYSKIYTYVQIERTLGKNLMKMRDTTADELYSQLSANKMLVRLI